MIAPDKTEVDQIEIILFILLNDSTGYNRYSVLNGQ